MEPANQQGIKVSAGSDRFQQGRKVFGVMPFMVKVAGQDTAGGCLIIEQANDYKGGPPRHLHHAQEEWFYVIEGQYIVEIGNQTHHLGPGDSVLAPRKVPHVWALTGTGAGRMLIVFQPAGQMEAFFDQASKLKGVLAYQELAQLFATHGMEVVGPPLSVGS
ncbi:MAG: cupin domain-containing protein [Thermaceae bacterium]|nr:cupin domain-containing protein [Thermaceae bacterium]